MSLLHIKIRNYYSLKTYLKIFNTHTYSKVPQWLYFQTAYMKNNELLIVLL